MTEQDDPLSKGTLIYQIAGHLKQKVGCTAETAHIVPYRLYIGNPVLMRGPVTENGVIGDRDLFYQGIRDIPILASHDKFVQCRVASAPDGNTIDQEDAEKITRAKHDLMRKH